MESPVVQCPPITTTRLKPFRQRLNRIIMTITDSGYVSMEVINSANGQAQEMVRELFYVSPDGLQIEIYQNAEGVRAIDGCPMPGEPYQSYSYPHLPAKQWKKYVHAYKFVEVVKSRTAKVLLVTDTARCKLMENSPPDFQASFTDGVTVMFSKDKVMVTESDGHSLTFDPESASSRIDANTLALVDYARQCQHQCLKVDKSVQELEAASPGQQLFPITVGSSKKPYEWSSEDNAGSESDERGWTQETQLPHFQQTQETNIIGHSLIPPQGVVTRDVSSAPLSGLMPLLRPEQELGSCYQGQGHQLVMQSSCAASHHVQAGDTHQTCSHCRSGEENLAVAPLHDGKSFEAVRVQACPQNSSQVSVASASPDYVSNCQRVDTGCHLRTCAKHTTSVKVDGYCQSQFSNPQFCDNPYVCSNSQEFHHVGSGEIRPNQVPYPSMCQTEACDNLIKLSHCQDDVPNVPKCLFQEGFVTPKKSQLPLQSQLHGYSVDSKHGHHKHKPKIENYNFTVGALVDERELQNVRRNLFCDKMLEEVVTSPTPTSDLRQDLLAIQPSPSLNLSDCSNSEQVPPGLDRDESQVVGPLASCLTDHFSHLNLSKQVVWQDGQLLALQSSLPKVMQNSQQLIYQDGKPFISQDGQSLMFSSDPKLQHVNSGFTETGTVKSVNTSGSSRHSSHKTCTCTLSVSCEMKEKLSRSANQNTSASNCGMRVVSPDSRRQNVITDVSLLSLSSSTSRNTNVVPPLKLAVQQDVTENQSHDSGIAEHLGSGSPASSQHDQLTSCPSPAKISACSSNPPLSQNSSNSCKSNAGPSLRLTLAPSVSWSPKKEFLVSPAGDRRLLDWQQPTQVGNSLDMSVSSYYSDSPSSTPSSGCDPVRQVFVPYTGWASFYASGAIWILYNDGTQLGLKATEAAMTYVDQDGTQKRYKNTDVVPEIVKLKLEKLPRVIELLMKAPPTGV